MSTQKTLRRKIAAHVRAKSRAKLRRKTTRRKPPVGVIWWGYSPIDGARLVAISTYARSEEEANGKTGLMAQIYIIRADMSPSDAIRTGCDVSCCGYCAARGRDGFEERGCYVNMSKGPRMVWEKYSAGGYRRIRPEAFRGFDVRWGAYGDPGMLPESLVRAVNAVSSGWTGYTHQHKQPFAQWCKGVFMASADTQAQEISLAADGWGVFRAMQRDGADQGDATICQNAVDDTKCKTCKACNGDAVRIVVPAHGPGAKWLPVERKRRLALAS